MPTLAHEVHRAFTTKKKTLALAESCTGGLLASLLTDVSGAGDYLRGSIVSYTDEVKRDVLRVDARVLEEKGAVTAEVARMMATGARDVLRADVAVSITGFAGPKVPPGGELGLVYLGLATATKVESHAWRFAPPRENVRREAADEAMRLALRAL